MDLEWDENGRTELDGEHNFTIQRPFRRGPESWQSSDSWQVSLPHQCDEWTIVGSYDKTTTHADAVAGLEKFIAEAQAALSVLREAGAKHGA